MTEWRYMQAFIEHFRRCGLADGEVVAVLSESQSRSALVETARLAAQSLGGRRLRRRRADARFAASRSDPIDRCLTSDRRQPGRDRRPVDRRVGHRLHGRGLAARARARRDPRPTGHGC